MNTSTLCVHCAENLMTSYTLNSAHTANVVTFILFRNVPSVCARVCMFVSWSYMNMTVQAN